MSSDRKRDRKQAGLSMTELLLTTAIIAVVASLALLQFGGSREQFQRENIAQQLKQSFERARFDSVKRRAESTATFARVEILSTTSYRLVIDRNNDGDTSDTEDGLTRSFAGQNITFDSTGLTFPVTVSFDRRGEVTTTGASIPQFLVCNGVCDDSNDNSSNANFVLVTPTGTVNLLPGGSTIPTFTAPAISTIPPATDIRDDVTLPGP